MIRGSITLLAILLLGAIPAAAKTFYWISHGSPADPVWTYLFPGVEQWSQDSGHTVNTSFHNGNVGAHQEAVRIAAAADGIVTGSIKRVFDQSGVEPGEIPIVGWGNSLDTTQEVFAGYVNADQWQDPQATSYIALSAAAMASSGIPPGFDVITGALYVDVDPLQHRDRFDRNRVYHRPGQWIVRHSPANPLFSLSGGERQSVAIARAMHFDSELIILDEPTDNLGVTETQGVLRFVREARDSGHSCILIAHNIHHVFQVVDRIVVLRHGQVVTDDIDPRTTTVEKVEWIITS